jgi:hypothetical protein
MAAQYCLSVWRRLLNQLVHVLFRTGLGPRHTYLLTVRGRRSGRSYPTPVRWRKGVGSGGSSRPMGRWDGCGMRGRLGRSP